MLQALEAGHTAIRRIVAAIGEMKAAVGRPKIAVEVPDVDPGIRQDVEGRLLEPLREAMRIPDKLENYAQVDRVFEGVVSSLPEEGSARADAKRVFGELKERILRDEVLDRGQRLDGRRFDEVRPIWSEVGVLPRVHGSAVFTRGETQALVTATLGTADDQQKMELVDGESYKRFMLHYNFPPFSVGETVKFLRGPGRREIGHGAPAGTQPDADDPLGAGLPVHDAGRVGHPRVERLVVDGERLRRNALALMDAGVPIRARWPASPWASSWKTGEGGTPRHAVLTDIQGAEDHFGDMDFKVAGTERRHHGPPAGHQGLRASARPSSCARRWPRRSAGRLHILQEMAEHDRRRRASRSRAHAPRMT